MRWEIGRKIRAVGVLGIVFSLVSAVILGLWVAPSQAVANGMLGEGASLSFANFARFSTQTANAENSESDPLQQTVSADEINDDTVTVIKRGHVDLGPRLVDGQWKALARDDSGNTPVWRPLDKTILQVNSAALMPAPTDEMYAFMGAKSGEEWYVVPQTENPEVLWLGWNTQDPAVTQSVDRGVTMQIGPVMGPGKSWMFLQNGTFGEPLLLVDGQKPQPQDVWVDVNTHVHANWVFTKPGVYLAGISFKATTLTGEEVVSTDVLRFVVGDTDPQLAIDADVSAVLAAMQSANQGAKTDVHAGEQGSGTENSVLKGNVQAHSPWFSSVVWVSIGVACIALGVIVLWALRRQKLNKAEQIQVQQEFAQ